MPITVQFDDLITDDDEPTLTGTGSQQYGDIQITIDVAAAIGGDNDVYNTKIIGGQYVHDISPTVLSTPKIFTTSAGTPTEDRYLMEPHLWRLNSGKIFACAHRGETHVDNTGRLVGRVSDDEMVTWGTEFVVHDDASGFDTRNQGGGVVAATGRVIIFFALYDWPLGSPTGNDREGVGFVYSDDECQTWSAPTYILNEFPPAEQASGAVIPFGRMMETSNGLLQMFYNRESCWCLRSTDNGVTWGNRVDLWISPLPSNSIVEPFLCKVDNNRFVCVIRDNTNPNSYRYIKTSDGGLTWGSIEGPYEHTSTTMNAAAPFKCFEYRGAILGCICTRDPEFQLKVSRTGLEEFWNRPWLAWAADNLTRINNVVSFNSAVSIDCGYAWPLDVTGAPETALIAYYDQDGAVGDTSIFTVQFPAVS